MSDLKEMWDSHKVTIIAASVLILFLMVGAVFLAPGLYVVVTLVGFLLVTFGGRMSGNREVQYMGILFVVVGIVGLTVLDVNSLTELGLIVAVVGGILLFLVENPRLRSRSNS